MGHYLISQLPDYMKMCLVAFFNSVNEMVYDILKEQSSDVLSHLKKAVLYLHSYLFPFLNFYDNNPGTCNSVVTDWIHGNMF